MNGFAICPYCNSEFYIGENTDTERDSEKIISYWVGHCPECGEKFRWEEVYLFNRIENLVEGDD